MKKPKKATFTQLRNNAASFFDRVESGETIQVYRHGKLAAILMPATENPTLARWKNVIPLEIDNLALSSVILNERKQKH